MTDLLDRSLVIETWNLGSARAEPARVATSLRALLVRLRSQTLPAVALRDLVVTHDGLDAAARARLDVVAGRAVTWIEVARGSDYYAHKNAGFDATRGAVVAFLDGDCVPAPRWLERLTAPIADGAALVVAGATRYRRGPAALAGTAVDFPVFPSPLAAGAVRGFFANNVAFARHVFAARRYPEVPGMFHGQCQLLGLTLQADGIAVHAAPEAAVEHAWPDGPRAFLAMRLLRGADTRAFTPHLLATYAPRLGRALAHTGPLPALAVLGARACRASAVLVRARPAARVLLAGAVVIAASSAIDAVGVLAARSVHERLA